MIGWILLAGWAWAGPTFGVSFPDTPYATLLKGTRHGFAAPEWDLKAKKLVQPGTSGLLFDRDDRAIGRFEVVLAGTDSSTARLDMAAGHFAEDVARIASPTARMDNILFTREDPTRYFRIDKGWRDMSATVLKAGAKGQLLDQQGRQAGLFRVIAVAEHDSVGLVTNIAQGVFNRDIHTGEIQNYVEQILSGVGIVNLSYLTSSCWLSGVCSSTSASPRVRTPAPGPHRFRHPGGQHSPAPPDLRRHLHLHDRPHHP